MCEVNRASYPLRVYITACGSTLPTAAGIIAEKYEYVRWSTNKKKHVRYHWSTPASLNYWHTLKCIYTHKEEEKSTRDFRKAYGNDTLSSGKQIPTQ